MPLSWHSVGTYPETSSHATCQGTIGHSRLSSLSHCGLILAQRVELGVRANLHFKMKTRRPGINRRTFSQNPRKRSSAARLKNAEAKAA